MVSRDISYGLKARAALAANGFRCTHSLGQNFILDDSFLSGLLDLAGLDPEDHVLEIGPGPGLLTALIAERAASVVSVELDEKLKSVLESVLSEVPNSEIIFADAMKTDLGRVVRDRKWENYRVIANLPYYITADLIQRIVLTNPLADSICIMVQKEAADRLMSSPGDKNWGAFAAVVRYYGDTTVLADVPSHVFEPAPHVESCFVRIDINKERLIPEEEERGFIRLIKASFAMRRKTLANNLKASYGIALSDAVSIIEDAGFTSTVRGESLTLIELSDIYSILKQRLNGGKQ